MWVIWLLLLLLSRFSRVRLCATPETAAHQAPRPWDSPGKNIGVGCHCLLKCMKVKSESEVVQSCPTLSDPMDYSTSGSLVPGILQARTLEWVAISFSNAWKWKVKVKSFSRVRLLATPWTAAYQAPPSMGFSRQEYWSGVPLPSPKASTRITIMFGKIRNFPWKETNKKWRYKASQYHSTVTFNWDQLELNKIRGL